MLLDSLLCCLALFPSQETSNQQSMTSLALSMLAAQQTYQKFGCLLADARRAAGRCEEPGAAS